MNRNSIDYDYLDRILNPDTSRVPLKGNEHNFVRVAFDLFRLKGDVKENLWQVQSNDDGEEFLVRTYLLPEENEKLLDGKESWAILADSKNENLTVAYNGTPIRRITASDYGAKTQEDVELLQKTIYKKLNSDDKFVDKFVDGLTQTQKDMLLEAGGPIRK